MSMFLCATCDNLRDADDGCEEDATGLRLVCLECAEEALADAIEADEEAEDRARMVNVGGHRDGGSAS